MDYISSLSLRATRKIAGPNTQRVALDLSSAPSTGYSPPLSPTPTPTGTSSPYSPFPGSASPRRSAGLSDKQLLKKAKLFLDERQRIKNRILSLISFTRMSPAN